MWEGFAKKDAYSEIDPEHAEASYHKAGGEEYGAILHNRSRGLFTAGDHVLHFATIEYEGKRMFGVEVFDREGDLIGYVPLENIQRDEHGVPVESAPEVEWGTEEGKFYLYEQGYGSIPTVKVIQIRLRKPL